MLDNFLDDFSMKDLAGTWLQFEQIKRVGDATGQNQQEVYNTPNKTQQVNDTVQPNTESGLSMPVMVGGAVAAVALLVLLLRK